jgi:hypothetical protein
MSSSSSCNGLALMYDMFSGTLPNGSALQMTSINILNWKHMVISMMKPKWSFQLCWKCFYNGFHMNLDTKLWALPGCTSQCLYPKGQSQQNSCSSPDSTHQYSLHNCHLREIASFIIICFLESNVLSGAC